MADRQKHIFILAGEPSGDRIGGDLLRRLNSRVEYIASGIGGNDMTGEGLTSSYPMSDLSVMGFADVIMRLPLLLWRNWQTARQILREKPDIVVLIDSQVFSSMLAARLRKAGFMAPILLYVAPAVWAWKPERAPKLAKLFDEVLAVLPFEPEFMDKLKGPKTSYVGHPALAIDELPFDNSDAAGLVALLPGSRLGEIRRHMPLFRKLAERLSSHSKVSGFILPTLPHLQEALREEVATWNAAVEIVVGREARTRALANTRAAIVTAGTVTLELALSGIPMVGTYIPDKRLMHHYEKAGRPMIALPNIILGHRIIPEIAPDEAMADALYSATTTLLEDDLARTAQLEAFRDMRALMEAGAELAPRQDPVDRVLAYLPDSSTEI